MSKLSNFSFQDWVRSSLTRQRIVSILAVPFLMAIIVLDFTSRASIAVYKTAVDMYSDSIADMYSTYQELWKKHEDNNGNI